MVEHRVLPSRPHGTGLKGEANRAQHTNVRGAARTLAAVPSAPSGILAGYGCPHDRLLEGVRPRSEGRWTMGQEWIVVGVIAVAVLFGAKKIPEMARSVGRAQGEFKRGMREGVIEDQAEAGQAPPAAESPASPAPSPATPPSQGAPPATTPTTDQPQTRPPQPPANGSQH